MSDPSLNPNASRTRLTLLWTQTQPLVMAFIRSMVHNHADAEDVLQQTAYDIAQNFDEYDPDRPFAAWAIGIAKFKVLSYRRDQGRKCEVFSDRAMEQIAGVYAQQADRLTDHSRALHHCMSKLSDKARKLIELRYVQDMKPAGIADQIGATANTISNALSRTRQALRECMERIAKQEGGR